MVYFVPPRGLCGSYLHHCHMPISLDAIQSDAASLNNICTNLSTSEKRLNELEGLQVKLVALTEKFYPFDT
jgi:hypothetical protein